MRLRTTFSSRFLARMANGEPCVECELMDAPELVAELRRVADEIESELQQMPGYLRKERERAGK